MQSVVDRFFCGHIVLDKVIVKLPVLVKNKRWQLTLFFPPHNNDNNEAHPATIPSTLRQGRHVKLGIGI
jgi:hypothetical protein